MERTIISHDVKTASAVVRFEHKDVVLEQTIDLTMVVPGSMRVFEEMGIEFNKAHQLKALNSYTASLELQIDQGVITSTPVELKSYYVAPPEPEAEPVPSDNKKSKA